MYEFSKEQKSTSSVESKKVRVHSEQKSTSPKRAKKYECTGREHQSRLSGRKSVLRRKHTNSTTDRGQ